MAKKRSNLGHAAGFKHSSMQVTIAVAVAKVIPIFLKFGPGRIEWRTSRAREPQVRSYACAQFANI